MKKTFKRVLAGTIAAMLLVGSMAGCSKDSGSNDGKLDGTVTFFTNRTDLDGDGTFDAIIEKFNEKYPDVTIEVESSTDYQNDIAIRMQTEEYADVSMISDAVPTSALGDYFVKLGTVDELSEKYTKEYLYAKAIGDDVYGLANMCNVAGIVYNKRIFKEAGIEELATSPEEFLAQLQMIKDNTDSIPYYTNTNAGWTLSQWENHASGSITGDPDYGSNGIIYDKEAFAPGASHYILSKLVFDIVDQGLCEDDPTTCDWEASKGMLNRGEIASMLLGSWAISQIVGADEFGDDIGYMPFPYSIDGVQYTSAATDYNYGINIHSKNQDAARAWVDFLVDESGLALAQGGISLLASDPLPSGLEDFEGVTYVVNSPAEEKNIGLLDEVQYESGVTLNDNGVRLSEVVDIARGASSKTFDGFMEELNTAWADGVTKVTE